MENLRNCLDLRNGQIICNGEEFMALPVALNESFSWVVCDWSHLSKLAKDRFVLCYHLEPKQVDYVVISTSRLGNLLSVEVYVHGQVHSRSVMLAGTILKKGYSSVDHKLAENEI